MSPSISMPLAVVTAKATSSPCGLGTHALRRGSVGSHLLETSVLRAGHKRFETKGSNRSDGPGLVDRTSSCLNGGPGQDAGREVVTVGAMHLDAVDQLAGGRARIRHDQGPRT